MLRWLVLALLMAALAVLEVLLGGARLAFAAAAAPLIGLAALAAMLPGWRTSGHPSAPAVVSAVCFGTYVLLRNRFSEVEYIGRLHFFIIAGSLAVYLLFAFVLTRPQDRKVFFGFVIVLCVLQLVPAAVQFFAEDGWMPLPFAQRRITTWRASGFFISPNNFAGFVEMGALLATAAALLGRMKTGWRLALLAAAAGCAAGVLVSGSRGGYIGLGAGVFTLTVLVLSVWTRARGPARAWRPAAVLGGLALVAAGAWWALAADATLHDRVEAINDVDHVRLHLWSSSLQQLKQSPLWGTGGFSFLYYGRMFRDPSVQGDPIHVHNDYLQLLADYGWAGAVLGAAMLLLHAVGGGRAFAQLRREVAAAGGRSDRLALLAGCLAVLAAYVAHSVVEFNVQLPLNALVVAAILAVLANPGAAGGRAADGEPLAGREVAVRTALVLTGVLLLGGAGRVLPGEYAVERARYALREGHTAEALAWAREGRAAAPDNPEVSFHAGEAALQLSFAPGAPARELRQEAVEHFEAGLQAFPYDSRLALKLAQAQAATGDYGGASESLIYAGQLDPNSGFVPAYRGIVEYWSGNTEAAAEAFEEAVTFGGGGAQIGRQGLQLLKSTTEATEAAGPGPTMPEAVRRAAERIAAEEE